MKRRQVEVKVVDTPSELLPAPLDEADVMLDAWVELPGPEPVATVRARLAPPPPPDIPDIPSELEGS